MKRYIRSSQVPNSYLYIFKHGIGPGTIPRDIEVIKTKDLPNGYTAVWLNRFLTYDELKQYDIPSETRINELLGRIGYCQKNGDVVPCSEVDACNDVTASIQLPIDPKDKIYDLYQIAIEWCDDSKVDQILINNGTSPDSKFIVDENTNVMQAYIDLVDYIRNNVSPDILNDEEYTLVYGDEVNACDKVTAATRPHPPIPAGWERIPEGDDEEGNWSTIFKELPNNGGYIWLDLYYDDNNRRYYELQIGYRNSDGTIGDIRPLTSESFYRLRDAVQYAEDRINRESESEEDIEGSEDIDECEDTRYFANMISASQGSSYYGYEIRGYYDKNKAGLAESKWVKDLWLLNAYANSFANKGYYLELRNNLAGTVVEISADDWFDNYYPSGIGEF